MVTNTIHLLFYIWSKAIKTGGLSMKYVKPALIVYVLACIVIFMLPTSEGYEGYSWRFLVGQVFAIPLFLFTTLVTAFLYKRKDINDEPIDKTL